MNSVSKTITTRAEIGECWQHPACLRPNAQARSQQNPEMKHCRLYHPQLFMSNQTKQVLG